MRTLIKLPVLPFASLVLFPLMLGNGAALAAEPEDHDNGDHYVLGAGVGYMPGYQGAKKYRITPIPVIDISWGPMFANLRNGVGVNALDTEHVTAGLSVVFVPGYLKHDAPKGIGALSDGVGGRGFVTFKYWGAAATFGVTQGFAGGTKGLLADALLSYPISVTPRFTLFPSVSTTWASGKYNDRYFGVTTSQSLASGLPVFHTGSGFKDASAFLAASYRLTDHIYLGASGGVTSLLGGVQDSPLVFHKTQPAGFMSVSYRFDR